MHVHPRSELNTLRTHEDARSHGEPKECLTTVTVDRCTCHVVPKKACQVASLSLALGHATQEDLDGGCNSGLPRMR